MNIEDRLASALIHLHSMPARTKGFAYWKEWTGALEDARLAIQEYDRRDMKTNQPVSAAAVEPAETCRVVAARDLCDEAHCFRVLASDARRSKDAREAYEFCASELEKMAGQTTMIASATPEAVRPDDDALTVQQIKDAEPMRLETALSFGDEPRLWDSLMCPADSKLELYTALRTVSAAYRAASTAASAGDAVTFEGLDAALVAYGKSPCDPELDDDPHKTAMRAALYAYERARPAAPVIAPGEDNPAFDEWIEIAVQAGDLQLAASKLSSRIQAFRESVPRKLSPPPSTGSDGQDAVAWRRRFARDNSRKYETHAFRATPPGDELGWEPLYSAQWPPREPTDSMSTAGKHYMKGQEELYERQQAIGCWRVMYDAAMAQLTARAGEGKSDA